jgi:hypothetical protein
VFALGNRQYEHYCLIGREVDKLMGKLGGVRIIDHGEGDDDGRCVAVFCVVFSCVFMIVLYCIPVLAHSLNWLASQCHVCVQFLQFYAHTLQHTRHRYTVLQCVLVRAP